MLSWHNDPALKATTLERMREHRRDDTIVQGAYQRLSPEKVSGYRGWAIGCTLPAQRRLPGGFYGDEVLPPNQGWHREVQEQYGIPEVLGYLIDHVFEHLPVGECADFAVNVIEAIPVGVDLMSAAIAMVA